MRLDLGVGPASLPALRRPAGTSLPTGFVPVEQGGQPILHRGEPVIVRAGDQT